MMVRIYYNFTFGDQIQGPQLIDKIERASMVLTCFQAVVFEFILLLFLYIRYSLVINI